MDEIDFQTDWAPNYVHPCPVIVPSDDQLDPTRIIDDVLFLQDLEDPKVKSPDSGPDDFREFSYKKLSASAAPYNPSLVAHHVAPLPLNISVPPGRGSTSPVGPWPINTTLHLSHATTILPNPICSSPHHPYPSPPPTPNMIHPLPLRYLPYTQAQSMQPSSFQAIGNSFHLQFTWRLNMPPNTSECIPGTAWPIIHPFVSSPTVVESISRPLLETKELSNTPENLNLLDNLPMVFYAGNKSQKDMILPPTEAADNSADIDVAGSENGDIFNISDFQAVPVPFFPLNSSTDSPYEGVCRCNDTHVERQQWEADREKTLSILVRGRRKGKQILRMPLSFLKRPYCSQPFKGLYCRVIRDTKLPRSTCFSLRR